MIFGIKEKLIILTSENQNREPMQGLQDRSDMISNLSYSRLILHEL